MGPIVNAQSRVMNKRKASSAMRANSYRVRSLARHHPGWVAGFARLRRACDGRFLVLMFGNVGLIGRLVFVWFFRAVGSLLSRPGDKRTADLEACNHIAMLGTESTIPHPMDRTRSHAPEVHVL